jgi:AcrR family transcriptional regulator
MDAVNPFLYASFEMAVTEPHNPPLRKDAERNRMRILEAARELFAERGLSVTLNDIAHYAGVGVGTVYRRFPDKSQLIDALFEQRIDELVAIAESSLEVRDPWQGLCSFLTRALELQADDRGLKEVLIGAPGAAQRTALARARMLPVAGALVARAQEAGKLRADFAAQDLPILQLMVGTVIDCARDLEPELWRRYLQIMLDGMRSNGARTKELSPGAPSPDRVQAVMAAWRPPRR